MNPLTDREKWDIGKIKDNSNYYSSLPERHRTEAVSMAAVLASVDNLEYVPETVLNKDICRAALNSKNVDCTILPYIPYPDVQKEGIQKFKENTPAFVLYSFADITDAKMAQDAVKEDAYCIQLVPEKLLTKELCETALKSPNADEKVRQFIGGRFPSLQPEIPKDEKRRQNEGVKMKF